MTFTYDDIDNLCDRHFFKNFRGPCLGCRLLDRMATPPKYLKPAPAFERHITPIVRALRARVKGSHGVSR